MAASAPSEDLNLPSHMEAIDNSDKPLLTPPNPQLSDEVTTEKRKRVDSEPEPTENQEEVGEAAKELNHPMWKTSLCSFFRRSSGTCSHGESCRYAHGEEELRPRPDNTWDPTSERAKKMTKTSSDCGESDKKAGILEADELMMTDAVVEDGEPELSKCFVNLPMKWHSDKLRSFLSDRGVLFKSAKKKTGMSVGFVSFENADQVKRAIEELDGKSVGNKNLKIASVIPRNFEKKNMVGLAPSEESNPTSSSDVMGVSESSTGAEDGSTIDENPNDSVLKGRSVRDVVTPLAHMSYADQLEQKKRNLTQTLKKLTKNARKACPNGVPLPEWIAKSREIGGLPCNFEGIVESPVVNGYRNKCEFSVGYSIQGKPTVGFLLGNFREGVTAVEEPVSCPNVSRISGRYAAIFQEFLQHSNLPIWNRLNNTGFWRQLTVREGRTQPKDCEIKDFEVMLMVQVCTVGYDDAVVNGELDEMAHAFAARASDSFPSMPLTALLVQDHKGISNVAPSDAPLRSLPVVKLKSDHGKETTDDIVEARIHDYINSLRFCISPTAFFQVNTLAAERLYNLVGDWAALGPDTLLFDICCGTGTIGLTLAHRVGMVVGIEMNASAVSDAERNAEINGIKNCRFVCSKAEDVMGSLLKEYINHPKKTDNAEVTHIKNSEEITANSGRGGVSEANIPDSKANSSPMVSGAEDTSVGINNGCPEAENQLQYGSDLETETKSAQQFKNVVAIVDPPRVGLHPTVIKALRTHPGLRRLVYVSCNPESLVANAIELCTPSSDNLEKGNRNNRQWRNMSNAGLARHRMKSMPNSEPFWPMKAMAVDLFPHTPHCELVLLLER